MSKFDSLWEYIPNIISTLRIILSACLLITEPFKIQFWCIYIICGFSDMVDGYLARKFNMTSKTGAILDSLGDAVFAVVMAVLVIWNVWIPAWCVVWIAVIVIIKLVSILAGYLKFHTFTTLHTYANKVVGFVLFAGTPIYIIWSFDIAAVLMLTIATLAAVEELLIILISKKLDRNIKSIFILIKYIYIK